MDPSSNAPQTETKLHFLDYWRIIRIRKTVILAVFLLVVITATVVTMIYPESYASTTTIKVEPDSTPLTPMTGDPRMMPRGYDPYFVETEFHVIQSELILDPVIKQLNLNELWSKKYGTGAVLKTDETRKQLQQQIDLRTVRNTTLIDIRVYSDKPEEAAQIANYIATNYYMYRSNLVSRSTLSGMDQLHEELLKKTEEVEVLQTNVNLLRQTLDITDPDVANFGPTWLVESESYRTQERQRVEFETRLGGETNQLEGLLKMNDEERAQALVTALPQGDIRLSELLAQKNMLEQALVKEETTGGDKNPGVIHARAAIEKNKEQISRAVKGILDGLTQRVESDKATLASIVAEVTKARKTDQEKLTQSGPYFDAKRKLDDATKFRSALQMKYSATMVDYMQPKFTSVEIVTIARPVYAAVKPNKTLNILLGVVVGLVVGVGLAFFIEYLDTSVKTIDDVERALGCPVLGVIPQNVGYILYEGAESPHAEAYRVLRTNLLFSRKDDKLNTLCVVSAGAGEGKTTTAINLATVFAQAGQRVLIVDSDLRRPTLHKLFRVANNAGLTSYLLKQNTLEEVIQTTNISTLNFLPSGKLPSSSLGILNSPAMKDLISELKQRFDFVVFDSPPMMGVSDASILASEVDLTMQVVQYRRYPQPMNIRAKQMIEKVGGTLIGIVLNNINMAQDESYYYYSGYYHDYYYSKKEDEASDSGKDADGKAKAEIKQKY